MEPTADQSATNARSLSPSSPPVRLSLAPYQAVLGGCDGAWWPYSYRLVDELAVLVVAMDGVGVITRVLLGIEPWPDLPHRISVRGHSVTAGWLTSGQEKNVIVLCSYLEGFRSLLVIPPAMPTDAAVRLMNSPVPVDGSRSATELLAIATARSEVVLVGDPL
ncbi:hypothetical protein J2X68_004684 [Streptomyces sp. 3330]|uniref:DUF5994 family protein n=1 Tax=Streptomyces sp. 3330 TaxID=2817755 RepID=UPI0028672DCE|nr:DUF5994 family protein [Streptomyces sp. 3330]MDR6977960.1 hypothetical protein [Streptomyces sp. 3330]